MVGGIVSSANMLLDEFNGVFLSKICTVPFGGFLGGKVFDVYDHYCPVNDPETKRLARNVVVLLSAAAGYFIKLEHLTLIALVSSVAYKVILKKIPVSHSYISRQFSLTLPSGIGEEEKKGLYKAAASLLNQGMNSSEVKEVLLAITSIAEGQIEKVCHTASRYIEFWMDGNCIASLLRSIAGIAEDQREGVLSAASRFMSVFINGDGIRSILSATAVIPEDQREEVLSAAALGIISSADVNYAGSVIRIVAEIPKDKREKVCRAARNLICSWMILENVQEIFWALGQIPEDQIEIVCRIASRFMEEGRSGEDAAVLLWAIGGIAEDQRESVISKAQCYMRPAMSTRELGILLWATGQIPEDQREKVFSRAQLILQSKLLPYGIGFFLDAIAGIPEDPRQGPEELDIGRVVKRLYNGPNSSGFYLALCIKFIGKKGSSIFSRDRESTDVELIYKKIKEELIEEITELMGDERNGMLLRIFIQQIESIRRHLNFRENDPLENLIVLAQIQINPALRGSDNIYAVHSALLEKKREITPPTAAHVIVAGELVKFNYQNLLQVGKVIEQPLTFAELPHINPRIFAELFQALDERLNKLPATEKAKVEQEISNCLGGELTLHEVKDKCIASDRRLSYWLTYRKGENDEIAPKLMVEAFKIAEILSNTPSELEAGDLLSPQERSLIAIAYTLTTCITGQEEGIHAAYVLAPKTNTGRSEIDELGKMESGEKVFGDYGIVMDCLRPLFQSQVAQADMTLSFDNSFMRQCAPRSLEIIHRSLYLKNLLNEELGLDHTVRLDLHGGCVDQNLRQMSKGEILKYYYGYSASKLVFAVRDFLNSEFENLDDVISEKKNKSKTLYNSVIKLLEQPIGMEAAIVMDPETSKVTCSQKGALQLLKKLGFFEPV